MRAVQLGSIDNGGYNKRYLVKPSSPFGPVRRVAIIPPAAAEGMCRLVLACLGIRVLLLRVRLLEEGSILGVHRYGDSTKN